MFFWHDVPSVDQAPQLADLPSLRDARDIIQRPRAAAVEREIAHRFGKGVVGRRRSQPFV
jgi:hypothetical protein